ncbi:MAG: anaerobic ribonucleoside-triphosphate reductase activating protein [Firmicutes bacterium]|nr:anaerobic ribonucleoside-triphosphate reductase activating protein [Bacillota bacterium]
MEVRLASNIQKDSILDGEGLRAVIWFQGCSHNCFGCHNPETHDFNKGFLVDIEELKKQIKDLKYHQGVTLSGGDPFFQVDAAYEIGKYCQQLGLNVWAYTGFLYEDILKNEKLKKLLEVVDVLVDGKFVLELKSLNYKFRGSSNQRIIDVKKSLEKGEVIKLYEN